MSHIIDYLLLEDGGKISLEDKPVQQDEFILLESTHRELGTIIENLTALTRDQSGYAVCMRSGHRAKPGTLVLDPRSKTWVLPKFVDEPQLTTEERSRPSKLRGSDRPEPNILYITDIITPEDL